MSGRVNTPSLDHDAPTVGTATPFAAPDPTRRFTPGRMFRAKMWGIAAASAGLTAALIWLPLANPDGSFRAPVTAALIGGGLFGAFTLLGVYLTLFAERAHVLTSPERIEVRGAVRERSIVLAAVTRARWRRNPHGGSIVLYTPGERTVIEFGVYEDWRDLSAFLRSAVPVAVQEGYEVFEASVLTVREPPVVGEAMTLRLAVASLGVALAYWAAWDVRWVRMTACLPLVFVPAIAGVAALDALRRRTPVALLAMITALAGVGCLFGALWPLVRALAF